MSGPKTSHYSIRAARLQAQERRQAEERKQREEMAALVAVANAKRTELERRTSRLSMAVSELNQRFPSEKIEVSIPDCRAPMTEDPGRLEDFVRRLEIQLNEAEFALRNTGDQAQANHDFRSATRSAVELCHGAASTAEEAMRRFVESKAMPSGGTMTDRRIEIDRLLGRQNSENWREVTPKLERLVMEALTVESESRFSALTTEIRIQVQAMKRQHDARRVDAGKAKALLDLLDAEVPLGEESLKQRLELVKVGAMPFSDEFDKMARYAIAKIAEADKAALQASATDIVKETLADLGYDVAPIEETLFAKGGKVYFRKAGWNDYCVRLTVRPDESKINFNVVRMKGQADEAASRESDIEAENAWCSGYQQFADTLAVRGLDTQLTRHLPVGAVPVQTIGAEEVTMAAFGPQQKKRKTDKTAKIRRGDGK